MFAADLRDINITCPHCGAQFVSSVDPSVEDQEYVEDCQVCCAPILLNLHIDWNHESIQVDARRENF